MAAGGVKARQPFAHAVVFVVGGGSYVEFANLQEYISRTTATSSSMASSSSNSKQITYGSTEILTPSAFVQSMAALGRL